MSTLCLLTLGLLAGGSRSQDEPVSALPLVQEGAIELPGVEGRIDHLTVDLARKRLYVAALGNDSVEVVDLEAGRRIRSLGGVREPQGILYLPDGDRLVVACGGSGTCEVYDGGTLGRVASLAAGPDADNVRYDGGGRRVLVGFDGGLAVLDATTWKALAPIALDGHAEGFQLDGRGRVFVNLPGARAIAAVDLGHNAVATNWRLDEAGSNYPMVLVSEAGRDGLCLVGCRSPSKLVSRSLDDGKRVAVGDLSGDVDDLFHDAERGRVYAACGEGFVDVFELEPAGPRRSARVATAPGARTCLFVPELDRLFVAVPHRGAQRAEVRVLEVRD